MDVINQRRKAVAAFIMAAIAVASSYGLRGLDDPAWLVWINSMLGTQFGIGNLVADIVTAMIPAVVHQVTNGPSPAASSASAIPAGEQNTMDRASRSDVG